MLSQRFHTTRASTVGEQIVQKEGPSGNIHTQGLLKLIQIEYFNLDEFKKTLNKNNLLEVAMYCTSVMETRKGAPKTLLVFCVRIRVFIYNPQCNFRIFLIELFVTC